MKQTITKREFINAFKSSEQYSNNFTTKGLSVLFDYLIEREEDLEQELELDVIGLCCDFQEMDADELLNAYIDIGDNVEEEWNDADRLEAYKNWLNDRTSVCGVTDSTIVFANF